MLWSDAIIRDAGGGFGSPLECGVAGRALSVASLGRPGIWIHTRVLVASRP